MYPENIIPQLISYFDTKLVILDCLYSPRIMYSCNDCELNVVN